ncbi:Qat anti-phage system TatD family nuclease QatD [Rhizobium leguminosarum]|uniref:Qat anti-phage system TatD family nuclease QatD n=1 Tax=Rhizobium leguminosarum TaxID=384 RepID=UPI000FEC7964|nr:Qat anti-phage system TatD family nuclease QatD [Rhizobium leguminosarum]RWX35241.1 TatD family deoxyribonuclease [Rhizobium leguminosarum]
MIDFHCHVDLFPSPERAVDEIDRADIYVLSVTNTPKAFPRTAQLSKGRKRIRTALGLHPQLVSERHGEVGLFRRLLSETRYVGEVGLDGGDEHAHNLDLQKDVFDEILAACAKVGGRVMSIHSRHASGEVLEALERRRDAGVAILHWFSGPLTHADKAVDIGAWFSVGLPMLRGKRAASFIKRIPRDRLLTETDAPFASTPGDHYPTTAVKKTLTALSVLWDCDEIETRRQLQANLRTLGGRAEAFKLATD